MGQRANKKKERIATLAKNLLLQNYCKACNHIKWVDERIIHSAHDEEWIKVPKCGSLVRARLGVEIRDIMSQEWSDFKNNGLEIPREDTCEYWE